MPSINRYALAAVALTLLAGCAPESYADVGSLPPGPVTAPPGSSTASPVPAVPACSPAGTRVTLGEVEAAMGLRAMGITLTNCGTVPLTVNGYPGLAMLDGDGAPLDVEVLQGIAAVATVERFDRPPAPLTVAPGGRVGALLVWRNTVDDLTKPVQAGKVLEVTPLPGAGRQALAVDGSIDIGTTGRVGVSPWLELDPPSSGPAGASPAPGR